MKYYVSDAYQLWVDENRKKDKTVNDDQTLYERYQETANQGDIMTSQVVRNKNFIVLDANRVHLDSTYRAIKAFETLDEAKIYARELTRSSNFGEYAVHEQRCSYSIDKESRPVLEKKFV